MRKEAGGQSVVTAAAYCEQAGPGPVLAELGQSMACREDA